VDAHPFAVTIPQYGREREDAMIKVGVFYPRTEKFDWDYYLGTHTPMIQKLLSPALKKVDVEKGLGGAGPGAPATYTTICNLHFDSIEAFQAAFSPHAGAIMNDIANYTDVQPVVQISEVKM
jgi:uncharacterized protein (TIGR02118 family)